MTTMRADPMKPETRRFRAGAAALLAGGVLLLGACHTEPLPVCNMSAIKDQRQVAAAPSALPGQPSPVLEMPLNSVSITDHNIIQKVYVRAVNARRTPTGTAEVYAQILNCTDHPLQAEARVQFYDTAQAPTEPVSAWRRLYLPPRTSNTYRESSLGADAVRYYMVEMREGQ